MNVIIAPIITEKSMNDAAKGRFTFKVAKTSNKKEIRKSVEEKFKVNVLKVATITMKGKLVRSGQKRMEKQTPEWKKAIVLVKEGQKIDLFEVGEQK